MEARGTSFGDTSCTSMAGGEPVEDDICRGNAGCGMNQRLIYSCMDHLHKAVFLNEYLIIFNYFNYFIFIIDPTI